MKNRCFVVVVVLAHYAKIFGKCSLDTYTTVFNFGCLLTVLVLRPTVTNLRIELGSRVSKRNTTRFLKDGN